MKNFFRVFILGTVLLSCIPFVHAKLMIAPVKIAADKIIFGACIEQQCKQEKERLLQEYTKTKAIDFTIFGNLPRSYQQAEINYFICVRDRCGSIGLKRIITGTVITAILAALALTAGGMYEHTLNQEKQRQVFQSYEKYNKNNPLKEEDKKLVSQFFLTSRAEKSSILQTQKDNLPFLYVIFALLQPDPVAFIQQHNLTNQQWINELQEHYGITVGGRKLYKEKQD